jgi:hypothetical protein
MLQEAVRMFSGLAMGQPMIWAQQNETPTDREMILSEERI